MIAFLLAAGTALVLYALLCWECAEHANTAARLDEALRRLRAIETDCERDTTADTADEWLRRVTR